MSVQQSHGGYGMPVSTMTGNPVLDQFRRELDSMAQQDRQWAMLNHEASRSALEYGAAVMTQSQKTFEALKDNQKWLLETGTMAAMQFTPYSPVDLIAGFSAMAAGSQFRLGGADLQPTIYGPGALTSPIARSLFEGYMGDAYQGLFPRNNRTFGFGDTDMGVLATELSQRGAFAGMEIGSLTENGLEFNQQTGQRINDYLSKAAQALSSIRDVMGGGSMQELLQIAERLVGQDMVTASPDFVRQRIDQTLGQALAFGLDPQSMLAHNYQTTQVTAALLQQQTGVPASQLMGSAAALSGYVDQYSLTAHYNNRESARIAAEEGRYTASFSLEELGGRTAQEMTFRFGQETSAMSALAAINSPGVTGEQRAAVQAALSDLFRAPNPDAAVAARARLDELTQQMSGVSSSELRGLVGAGGIQRMISPQDLANLAPDLFLGSNPQNYMDIANAMGLDGGFADTFWMFDRAFSPHTQREIIRRMQSGEDFSELVTSRASDLEAIGGSAAEMLGSLRGGGAGLAANLSRAGHLANSMANMAGRPHAESMRQAEAAQFVAAVELAGKTDQAPNNMFLNFIQGVAGVRGAFSTDDVMDQAASGVGVLKLKDDHSAYAADEAAIQELVAASGPAIFAAFGVREGDVTGLRAAINDPANRNKVHQVLSNSQLGLMTDFEINDQQNGLRFMGKKQFDAQQGAMGVEYQLRMYGVVSGQDISDTDIRGALEAYGRGEDPKAFLNKHSKAARDMLLDGSQTAEFNRRFEEGDLTFVGAAREVASRDPSILNGLRDRQAELMDKARAEKDEVAKQKLVEQAKEVQELRRNLEGGGDQQLQGTLRLEGWEVLIDLMADRLGLAQTP